MHLNENAILISLLGFILYTNSNMPLLTCTNIYMHMYTYIISATPNNFYIDFSI